MRTFRATDNEGATTTMLNHKKKVVGGLASAIVLLLAVAAWAILNFSLGITGSGTANNTNVAWNGISTNDAVQANSNDPTAPGQSPTRASGNLASCDATLSNGTASLNLQGIYGGYYCTLTVNVTPTGNQTKVQGITLTQGGPQFAAAVQTCGQLLDPAAGGTTVSFAVKAVGPFTAGQAYPITGHLDVVDAGSYVPANCTDWSTL